MNHLLDWIWYSQLFSYGSVRASELLQTILPEELRNISKSSLSELAFLREKEIHAITHTSLRRAEMILEACRESGIDVIPFYHESYPKSLKEVYAPPIVLYAKGDLSWLDDTPALSVVGTRTASEYGLRVTGNLCYELAKAGMAIVSGCAVGIDARAHQGALKAGGKTIAVLGCGLDVNYPAENRLLKAAILDHGGALLSELPPGTHPKPNLFPVRNRLIAGLSLGTLVAEAPGKSGALITASYSLETGKEVFCIPPHDIYDPRFEGVASFIRDGAVTVCSAYDILREYSLVYPHKLDVEMVRRSVRSKSTSFQTVAAPSKKVSVSKPQAVDLSVKKL